MLSKIAIGLFALPVAVAAQGAPAQPAPTQPAPSQEAAFDTGLAAVHAQIQKAKWNDARTALLELLRAHSNQAYVQAQCDAIVSDLRTCAFYAAAKVPKLSTLITGKIASYDERSQKIKVVYDDSFTDWKGEKDELLVNPLVFAGGYTITATGKSYPGDLDVAFDLDPMGDGWFVASFGSADFSHDAAISQGGGEGEPRLIARADSPARSGKPFTAVLRIGDDRIKMLFDNKPVLEAKRTNAEFGQVGIWKVKGDQLVLEGRIEPSCLQSRIDEELGKQREEFDKAFVPKKELPAWLFERPELKRTPTKTESHVPGLERGCSRAFEAVMQSIAEGKLVEASAAIAKLGDQDASPVARSFVEALLHVRAGRPESADTICGRLLAGGTPMTPARLLRARALEAMGRPAEAIAELETAMRDDPGYVPVHEQLCVMLMRHNRVADARRVVREAKTKHGLWKETAALEHMLAMAARGPNWPRRFSFCSTHYEVVSDIDSKVCFDACQILEASYANLMSQLTWIKEDKSLPRFRVFLFSGENGYQEYNKAILGEAVPHSAGLYTPVLKQLLIWNLPRREDMVRTIRHEGFHQFLDRIMENPPTWLNEGTAEYWETATRTQGRMQGGQVRTDHIATLMRSKKSLPKLRDFVYGGDDFYVYAQQRYAQAWALVHFLRKGPPVHTARFDKLWGELRAAKSTHKALDVAFAGVDWDKFEQEFWQHLASLK
ncbi:MAG TPA: tetratricopeptide repeat protein [Planctomycetota bacterium]|nr:tetratricopeptide repeat protein [Planctomycetota bacterium]